MLCQENDFTATIQTPRIRLPPDSRFCITATHKASSLILVLGFFLSDIGRYIMCISGTQKVSLMGCSSIVDSNLLRLGR
jgi:hypothetical protein